MKLNRAELRKITYDFNSISNRLLQANYNDYNSVLSKFIYFIKSNELISKYIESCGECDQDLPTEFKEISAAFGDLIFSLGSLDEEEVRNIFAILNYIVDNNIEVYHRIAIGYSSSTKYQDKIKGFNDRVVKVLIHHIERYLTKIGIDMGVDEKITYLINAQNGQVNISNDNSTLNANNYNDIIDITKLNQLINTIKQNTNGLSPEDEENLVINTEVIQEELTAVKPRSKFIKSAISGLKAIKGTIELTTAITALVQFLTPIIN
ncbi:hypothetical protein [Proteiniclasticum ruminis]|uniref:hypothetical protein n=1 Tax=Proteiniclasticum ruminis TaxID=398199 RepID=UPI0028ACFEC3|nr:hypothetical protein [Proteiniclasticum ruminis]